MKLSLTFGFEMGFGILFCIRQVLDEDKSVLRKMFGADIWRLNTLYAL